MKNVKRLTWWIISLSFYMFIFPVKPAVFYVTTTNANGEGSLYEAISAANANEGADKILFNIAGYPPFRIAPTSNLPEISEEVEIDATTQPGYTGTPIVELNGSFAGTNGIGFHITANNCVIKGFVINKFKLYGIYINEGSSNKIIGNFIGTDQSGLLASANEISGIYSNSSSYNLVESNLLSGGNRFGIMITNANYNVLRGNVIGLASTKTNKLGNLQHGIVIWSGSFNKIGDGTPSGRNIISGNFETGILLLGEETKSNVISGNYIGTDFSGTIALGNGLDGIYIYNGVGNIIGGNSYESGNLISGNGANGITINNPLAHNNVIIGNLIGTDITGLGALGNSGNGVAIVGRSNIVGSLSLKPANLISGNGLNGIYITGVTSAYNRVYGNFIGVSFIGTNSLSNNVCGVLIEDAPNNFIGGSENGAGNLISGHIRGNGIYIRGATAQSNIIQGNWIGLSVYGTNAIPNASGIGITNASKNIIGGYSIFSRNILSGNQYNGIYIQGQGSFGNIVIGNYVGTDYTGKRSVFNNSDAIYIINAPSNIIGVAGGGNVISGNNFVGLTFDGAGSVGNVARGNIIGMTADCSQTLGNALHSIEITGGASYNTIGGTSVNEGNIITGARAPGYDGIRIRDGCIGNRIQRNSIFGNGGATGLGIDLSVDGVSVNDIGDSDSGANNLQNFPILSTVYGNYKVAISGALNSLPNQVYTIDFYYNFLSKQSGCGEGQFWLGSTNVLTDNSGNVNFQVVFTNTVLTTGYVCATATDLNGNTSEFGSNIVLNASTLVDSDSDGMPNEYEIAWGFNPNLASDAYADSDGDGKSNLQEFKDGTNPRNAADKINIQISELDFDRHSLILKFKASYGLTYNIYYASKVAGPWTLSTTNINGYNQEIPILLPTDTQTRFYKIQSVK